MVRIFKNLRNHCIANDFVTPEAAPSYFVSCLIYNAPDLAFKKDLDDTALAILQWCTVSATKRGKSCFAKTNFSICAATFPIYGNRSTRKSFVMPQLLHGTTGASE